MEFLASSWRYTIIKLLILLNVGCYLTLAYLIIRMHVFFLSFDFHSGKSSLEDADYFEDKIILFGLFSAALAASLFLQFMEKSLIATASQQIESTLRMRVLRAMLLKDIAWFDRPQNSAKKLTSVLTQDVRALAEGSLQRAFGYFEIKWTLVGASIFSGVICWQNTIFLVFMSPLFIGAVYYFKLLLLREHTPHDESLATDNNTSAQHAMLIDLVRNHKVIVRMSETNRGLIHSAHESFL